MIDGEALDIVVDIRVGSPYFGRWVSVILSAAKHNQIYIPGGFAHGFLALTDSVQFLYKCSDYHTPGDEFGVLWNDPDLAISWEVTSPSLSTKDAHNPRLADIPRDQLPQYKSE